jgi:amino acid transporter
MSLVGVSMLVAVSSVIEGLASVATLCCVLVVGLFGLALRAHRDRRRFRITEASLFSLTSIAMILITEVCLKLPEPDQSTLSLLPCRKAHVLAALITPFIWSSIDTEYRPLIGTLLLADADGVVDLEVDSDQEDQIEENK